MPVLAEKTVVATSAIENCKIQMTSFCCGTTGMFGITCACAAWAKPPSNAVGGKRVIIPLEDTFRWGATHPDEPTVNVEN